MGILTRLKKRFFPCQHPAQWIGLRRRNVMYEPHLGKMTVYLRCKRCGIEIDVDNIYTTINPEPGSSGGRLGLL